MRTNRNYKDYEGGVSRFAADRHSVAASLEQETERTHQLMTVTPHSVTRSPVCYAQRIRDSQGAINPTAGDRAEKLQARRVFVGEMWTPAGGPDRPGTYEWPLSESKIHQES